MTISKTKKKFAFDVGWVFIASVVVLVIRFLRQTVLARYLGPSELGLFSMCIMIGSIFSLIGGFGFEGAIVKYAAEYKKDKHKLSQLVSNALLTMVIFGVISSAILLILSDSLASIFDMPRLSLLLKIFALTFPFSLTFTIVFGVLNGLRQMEYYSYADISRALLAFLTILIFILAGFGIRGAIIGYVLAEIMVTCVFIIIVKKYISFTTRGYKQISKKLASFGSKLVGTNAISMINYQADTLLIGYFLTASDVGYYAVAAALSRFFWIIPQAIQKITYPATSELWAKNNHSALQKMIDKSMKYSAYILLPVGLGVGFFAKNIVTITFGKEFVYSVLPLLILITGAIINGATGRPIAGTLAGIGRADLTLKIAASAATANIILNIILIPSIGIVGAAIATATSLTIMALLNLFLIAKNAAIKFDLRWYGKLMAIVIIGLLICYFFGFNPYAKIAVILFVIFALSIFLLEKEDRSYFLEIIISAKSYLSKFL